MKQQKHKKHSGQMGSFPARGLSIVLTLICDTQKMPCQTLIEFKKLWVKFISIWNKATDNIAINFYYLALINMDFFQPFCRKLLSSAPDRVKLLS